MLSLVFCRFFIIIVVTVIPIASSPSISSDSDFSELYNRNLVSAFTSYRLLLKRRLMWLCLLCSLFISQITEASAFQISLSLFWGKDIGYIGKV